MNYSYDPEAVYQDADVAAAEDRLVGRAIAKAQAQGVCCHLSAVGWIATPVYPEQEGLEPGQMRCTDGCGTVFSSDEDWYAAMNSAIGY